ncbi:ATP-binding protein [Sphingomonas sp.]|uniref:ATP-binding protein n=1 Tax=Sphingomonas sp. TaxID=28214 RepID=UPI0025EFADD9|nr:ATP-binding protein [Sphingomonas sp.]
MGNGLSKDGAPGQSWRTAGLLLAGLFALVSIAALVSSLVIATRQRDAALGWQQHSYEVMILARELDATMAKSEATLGRFVISGNKDVGRTYFDAWRRAGTLLDKLTSETRDRPEQRALIGALRDAFTVRGGELSDVALRTNYGQNDQALSTYYEAGKAPSLARLDGLLTRIIANERAILATRTLTADNTVARSNRISAILAAVGLIILLCAAWLGRSAWAAWRDRQDEEERNSELEYAVAERTGELSEANARLIAEMGEREIAEERLRQAQKMEAVGQLTGGIAHDFNNMLGVVIGGIELARRRIDEPAPEIERYLDNALEGANRAAALTKRLLSFARAEPLLPVGLYSDTLVGGMADMLDRTLGDTIQVVISAGARWPIFIDAHQLENALLNLAVNARDAMEGGGTLTLSTADVNLVEGEIAEAPAGDYVRIAVSDTGSGMSANVLERIFDPFFTTKTVGKGTGLGLSQIFGFVRQSDGGVAATSMPGQGTTVSIFLPRYRGNVVAIADQAAPADGRPLHSGVVTLVIEDDPRVLNATVDALIELGHEPLPCASAAEVPALLRERRDIGLIVSDVLMPGVTGPELVAAIHILHPQMPVLFVTGFAGDIEDPQAFGGHEVLRKPFTIGRLGDAVARVLDRANAAQSQAA